VVDINSPGGGALANGNRLRVGRGSESEYLVVDAAGIGTANHVALNYPLARAHAGSVEAFARAATVIGPPAPQLEVAAAAGATTIDIRVGAIADIAVDQLLEIGSDPMSAEHRFVVGVATVSSVVPRVVRATLDSPLSADHGDPAVSPPGVNVSVLDLTGAATATSPFEAGREALPRDGVVYVTTPGAFTNRAHILVFDGGVAAPPGGTRPREARRLGSLSLLAPGSGAYDRYDAGAGVSRVTMTAAGGTAKSTAGASALDANVVGLDDRVGLVAGTVLRVGAAAPFEYVTAAALPSRSPGGAAPDAGQVILEHGLSRAYPAGTPVVAMQAPVVDVSRPATTLALAAPADATTFIVTDGGAGGSLFAAGDVVRIASGGGEFFHELAADARVAAARPIVFTHPFARPHAVGVPVAERAALLRVQALDSGAWGNRLRISVVDEDPGLVSRTPVVAALAPNRLRLGSPAGVEAGSVLELVDPAGAVLVIVKVQAIDRATAEVVLDAAGNVLTPAQIGTLSAVNHVARSREFRLTVRLLAAPDPSVPGSGDQVLDREDFRNLSLDPRHSRYVERVVGRIGGVPLRLSDRRADGESWYVRLQDLVPATAIRLGPEALTDRLADGRLEPARHVLEDVRGDDSMLTLTDARYVGADSNDPEQRTGLFSLRNIEDISIVAIPGRTSAALQNALINHCELARYRFAVLDAHRPPQDAIADVINQRQQYDTKYAAIYHPWLLIPPPFPASAAEPDEYPIPPSGHMVGVYARTDIERGVHKAPANEVVRGIVGLQRLINKGEHDILNPYPININVIRDFRANSRGIRAYGGRVITSDSDWKYVNVRRLLIFIEASINRGLQWVVFEPNAEPLWARVRRSIANFLTLVWRNGALEGTKVEEAFFVKCDRTTMTQTDIDSGRLICVVGVAPVKPAEFVIVRIGLWTAHADD
jgi:hypothetical protein